MKKELTYIGLGRMGEAMTARLTESRYKVHGYDISMSARSSAELQGVRTYDSITEAIQAQNTPRIIWVMVPSRFVEDVLEDIKSVTEAGDTIIDGGNSFFKDSLERHEHFALSHIKFIDCGTSADSERARVGATLMVGGDIDDIKPVEHIFKTLATASSYCYVGGPGSGHFAKMIHNGIEYAMMGALAEGINILEEHKAGLDMDIIEVLRAYQYGNIIPKNLASWLAANYSSPAYLEQVAHSGPTGETEMDVEYIVNHNKAQVLQAAVTQRKLTRREPTVTGTLISAMRNMFGGHKTNDD